MKNKILTRGMIAAFMTLSLACAAFASTEGTDDASAPAYKTGWAEGTNGSTSGGAFEGWHFGVKPDGTSDAGWFLGDSTKLANPGPDVNAAGKAFGLYGKNAKGTYCEAAAYRDFAGGGLTAGQTFSIDLGVNYRNGIKGIDIRGGSAGAGDRPVILTFAIASDDYAVSNATTGNGSTKWVFKDSAPIHLKLTQTSASGGTWELTRGADATLTGAYSGVASGLKLFCGNTDGTDSDNLFANRLSIAH